MLIGIDNIIGWVRSNNTPYWYLKSGGSEKAYLLSSSGRDEGEQIALEDSVNRLRTELERLANGNYFIQAWQSQGQKKSWFSSPFQITASSVIQGHTGTQIPAINGITADEVEKRIAAAIAGEQEKQRIKQLEKELAETKKELRELQKESDTAATRVSNKIVDLLDAYDILPSKPAGTAKAATSTPTPPVQLSGAELDEESQKIGDLMEEWAKTDPNFAQTLRGIVELAKQNPAKYSMGKKFLT